MRHNSLNTRGVKPPKAASVMRRKVSASQRDDAIRLYLELLDVPKALMVWMLYSSGEHEQLVKLTIDPLQYNDVDEFRHSYAAVKFLSKCVGLKTGIDLKGVAIASAETAELQCLETNRRILSYRKGSVRNPHDPEWFRASQIIASILGPVPRSFEDMGWSRGRTSSAHGNEVASVYKYTSRLDVTWSAQRYAVRTLRASPIWGAAALKADGPCSVLTKALNIVSGNTLITVPKSAKTDRVICYEPHMNIRCQLQVGSYIRQRLMRHGINLNDQSINQRRASLGSKTGSLATIDLSMASDTISRELVTELLPCEWVDVLNDLRSRYTTWPNGDVRENQKFSSMGNGFTFELESLIFYALASAVCDNVSVFGDDIICPSSGFHDVKNVLEHAGFALNTSKSYHDGPFRESCGQDSFRGVDCTPVYLRALPRATEDVIKFHNAMRLWWSKSSKRTNSIALSLWKLRRVHNGPWGPSGYGDGHYHTNFDEARPSRANADRGWDGWWFTTYSLFYRKGGLYGDRVSGRFSDEFSWGALCASLGPKNPRNLVATDSDRRRLLYKRHRGLASFMWPDVVW